MDEKRKMARTDWLRLFEMMSVLLFLIVVIFALVYAAILPAIQWQADMQACMRMLGMTEQNCADYLRLIRE